MSLYAQTFLVTEAEPVLLATPTGDANVSTTVFIKPPGDILIGGAEDQTFTVGTAGIELTLIAGDDVWAILPEAGFSNVRVLVTNV